MLVVRPDRRVVVARDALHASSAQTFDAFVRPRSVPDQIAEMKRRVDAGPLRNVLQHGIESRKIRVNVGDQCVSHVTSLGLDGWFMLTHTVPPAVCARASRRSVVPDRAMLCR